MGGVLATACCGVCCAGAEIKDKDAGLKKSAERGCTDVICLVFYIAAILGFVFVSGLGLRYGNLNGPMVDGYGNNCTEESGRPYLYVNNPDNILVQLFTSARESHKTSICVKTCPNYSYSNIRGLADDSNQLNQQQKTHYKENLCNNKDEFKWNDPNTAVAGECMYFIVPTINAGNLCIPNVGDGVLSIFQQTANVATNLAPDSYSEIGIRNASVIINKAKNFEVTAFLDEFAADCETTWEYIVGILCGVAVLALITTLCMRWLSTLTIYLSIIAFLGGLAGSSAFCFYNYHRMRDGELERSRELPKTLISLNDIPYKYWPDAANFWLMLASIILVLFVIFLLITVAVRKRIARAIGVMKVASSALASSPLAGIFPLFPFAISCGIIFTFVVAFWSLHTMPELIEHSHFQWLSDYIVVFKLALLFTCVWQVAFLTGFQKVTLSGCYSEYYWNGSSSFVRSFFRCIKYHLGTIAFGSFIIAGLRFSLILLIILMKSKKLTNKLKTIAKWVATFIACIERMMNYINDRAYIMVALKGKNYISSARLGMGLIIRNPLMGLVLDGSAFFVLWLARLIVTGAAIIGGYFAFYSKFGDQELQNELIHPWVPILVVAFGALVVSYPFFLVHSVAIETVFLCFLEDFERNDGTADKPYANSQVQQYFGKEYKRIKNNRKKKAAAYSMEDDEIREMNENQFKFKSKLDSGSLREMR